MKKRNIFLGIIVFFMIFMLTGCKNKEVITTSQFISTVEKSGYTVMDATSQYAEYPSFLEVTIATKEGYQIEFYIFDNESSAKMAFDNSKATFEESKSSVSSHSEVTLKNYSTYTLNSNNKYMYLCKVDNTLFYADVDEAYKDQVKSIVKELGY